MAEPPEYEDLARRYAELWQEHLSRMAADPQWTAAFARIFPPGQDPAAFGPAAWLQTLAAGMPGVAGTPGAAGMPGDGADEGPKGAAAPASDAGGDRLGEFERRLASVEERLDGLERSPRGRKPA